MVIAKRVDHNYFHERRTNKCTRLYSTYELKASGVEYKVKVELLWNRGGSCKIKVWVPQDLEWKGVASFKGEWPKSKWSYGCNGSRLNPELNYSHGDAGPPPEGDGKHRLNIHNTFVVEQDRTIALRVEQETLKQACWVLFGVNEYPEVEDEK